MVRKRGPGRPEKPKNEALSEVIQVRFTKAERAEFEKKAKKADLLLSQWVRNVLQNAPD